LLAAGKRRGNEWARLRWLWMENLKVFQSITTIEKDLTYWNDRTKTEWARAFDSKVQRLGRKGGRMSWLAK